MTPFAHLLLPRSSNNHRAKILHPGSISALLALFLIFQLVLSRASSTFPQILGFASQIPPSEIITLTNKERQSRGLSDLRLDSQLSQAAALKAADMIARDYWAHVSPLGTQPWTFFSAAGYSYRFAGENLARDFANPSAVVSAWMDSPSHRDNLLSNRYEDIGVAVVDGRLTGKDTTLVVQMFGTRLGSTGASSSTSVVAKANDVPSAPTAAPSAPPQPTGQPQIAASFVPLGVSQTSSFDITKYVSLGMLILISAVLLIDVVLVRSRKIMRWTSKSLAHFIFLSIVLVAVATIIRGRII